MMGGHIDVAMMAGSAAHIKRHKERARPVDKGASGWYNEDAPFEGDKAIQNKMTCACVEEEYPCGC